MQTDKSLLDFVKKISEFGQILVIFCRGVFETCFCVVMVQHEICLLVLFCKALAS